MDKATIDALASFSGQLAEIADNAKQGVSLGKQTLRNQTRFNGKLLSLEKDVAQLKKHVFGENPPPNAPPTAPSLLEPSEHHDKEEDENELEKRVTDNEGELHDVIGRVMALSGEVKDVKKKVENVERINVDQSEKIDDIFVKIGASFQGISGFLTNPKVITIGRIFFAGLMAYAIGKGWIAK